jgi:tetratricopeptide (TPR) repeat protein
LYLIFLLILLTFRVTAQQFNVDSLRHTLNTTVSDSERIVALNAMAMHYAGISLDTARKLVDQAFALAKKTGSESGQASCNNSLGWLKFVEGKNDTAIILIESGFKYYMRIHDLANSARAAQNLAEIFINQKDFVKALTWARKSADLQEDVGKNIGLLTAFKEIAIIYREMGNSDSSIHYFQKAIDLGESYNEKSYTSDAYVSMGILYLKQGKYDEGLAAFQHSYNLSESINRKMGMAMARENMGDAYSKMKKYPAALASYQYALDYFKSNNQRLDWGYENINVGNVYRAMGNYTASISSYREALHLFELVGSNTYLPDVYQGLSETYNLQGDFKNAFEAYKNYITLRDSIFSEEQKSKLAELTTQYESGEKG